MMENRYSEDWQMEAVLKDTLVGRDYMYAEGFKDAAEALAKQATGHGINMLVYPIIFNYRQYFELTLKRLRIQCAAYESVTSARPPARTTYLKTHSLSKLWADVRPHLIAHLGTSEGFEAADEGIAYLDRLDPSSEMARYWETTKGGELHDLDRFNVGAFMNTCADAAAVLYGSEAMLGEYLLLVTSAVLAASVTPLALPDSRLTPGAVGTNDNAPVSVTQVCTRGYARAARHPYDAEWRRYRTAIFREYGIPHADWHNFRIDHLEPLELAGRPFGLITGLDGRATWDLRNVWPEPKSQAPQKDAVENALHSAVCDPGGYHGIHLTLAEAQRAIARDWTRTPVGLPPPEDRSGE